MVKRGLQKVKKRNILSIFGNSFTEYWKALHVALPMLIFSIIAIILFIVFAVVALALMLPLLNFDLDSSIGKNLSFQPQPSPSLLFSNPSSLVKNLIILLVVGGLLFVVGVILYALFFSSTLVFAKGLVKSEEGKIKARGARESYFKLSFKNGGYWLKLIGVGALQAILAIVYFAIIIGILFAVKNPIATVVIGLIGLIAAYFLYIFIAPMPYALVFYDIGVFKSFKVSVKNAAHCYWPLLGLILLIDLCASAASFVFSFIPFVGVFITFLVNLLFFIPFKALALLHFIDERFSVA
jgi:flagellar basal body-associated protein FliL